MHSAPCLCNKWLFSCIPYIFCKLAKRVPIFSLKYYYTVLYWWHWLNWEDLVCRSIIILFSISLSAKSTFNLKIIYPSFVTESQSIKRPNSKEFTYKREIKTLSYFVTFIIHVYLFLTTDMKSQTKWLQRFDTKSKMSVQCLFKSPNKKKLTIWSPWNTGNRIFMQHAGIQHSAVTVPDLTGNQW